ncbi:MAG: hypothetical protein IPL15_00005 [Comamonadaceae bacterium]|uniref:hypothetical protein n=1 Tax=Candidatus Skiveiella danica TaxID=3386177 RepID=UPI00390A022A|nr:hypothetical protein [Comamonadaceae bacterium]
MVVTAEADDGAEALQLARQQTWDVFLLDVSDAQPQRASSTPETVEEGIPKRLPVPILGMHPE